MSISREQILHVAKLAMLELTEDEILNMDKHLNEILTYVEQLNEVQTDNVVPTSHICGGKNVLRDDIPEGSFTKLEISSNAPDFDNKGFKVPKIINN